MIGPLLIRADASAAMGMGHLLRTLALAQAWQDRGGRVVLATIDPPPRARARIEREGVEIVTCAASPGGDDDLAWTLAEARARGARVVIDGYHLGPRFANALADAGLATLLVDDEGTEDELRAAVLNQNLHGTPARYPRARGPLLIGSRFAMLRRELRARARRPLSAPRAIATEVVVSFGGADPAGLSPQAVRAIAATGIEGARAIVVIGPAARRGMDLGARGVEIEVHVDPPDVFALFERAELAVIAAGSTVWELAYLGVPMLLVSTAPNQEPVLAAAEAAGIARGLGDAARFRSEETAGAIADVMRDPGARAAMTRAGRALIDGNGALRVCDALAAW